MRNHLVYSVLFIFFSNILCQTHNNQSEEIKINNDNMPSTFIQSQAKLFDFDENGFMVTWKDTRDGEFSTYAQLFDSSSNSIGSNFRIFADDAVIYHKNKQLLCIDNSGYFFLTGCLYSDELSPGKMFPIGNISTGCVLIGNPKPIFTVSTTNSSYVVGMCVNGESYLKTFDLNGVQLSEYYNLDWGIVNLTSTAINDDYMLLYFIGIDDFLDGGVYASFFNDSNQVVSSVELVKPYENLPDLDTDYGPTLIARALPNSEYQTIIFDEDSLKVIINHFDTLGQKTNETEIIKLDFIPNTNPTVYNFSQSYLKNNQFVIYITLEVNSLSEFKSWRLLFDQSGEFLDLKTFDNKMPRLGSEIKHISDNNYYIPYSSNDDIYLSRMSDFTLADSSKTNDDVLGGNDVKPFISNYDEQTYFISWEDELKKNAQLISKTGQKLGASFNIENKNCEFFSDGKIISYWDIRSADYDFYVGYTIYDRNWNEIFCDTLGNINTYFNNNILAQKIDDQIITLYRDKDQIYAALVNSEGVVIKKQVTSADYRYYTMDLFIEKESEIWIGYGTNLQCFNKQLEEKSSVYSIPNNSSYIGNSRCVRIQQYDAPINDTYYIMNIYSFSDSVLVEEILGYNLSDVKIHMLGKYNFMVTYREGNTLANKIFNLNGEQINSEFRFVSDSLGSQKDLTVSKNGDQFLFAWADSRNGGLGYDIFGSLYKFEDVITSVKETAFSRLPTKFNLSQNYPNPFNPTTTIEYTIPNSAHSSEFVSLKIYDILGREVATLVNEYQPAGSYSITFDGSQLASGIYYYQLINGVSSITKKMCVLK